jgi:hypothetical protein
MGAILDMIDFMGGIGRGVGALIAIGLIFTGRLTVRNFVKKAQWF